MNCLKGGEWEGIRKYIIHKLIKFTSFDRLINVKYSY